MHFISNSKFEVHLCQDSPENYGTEKMCDLQKVRGGYWLRLSNVSFSVYQL